MAIQLSTITSTTRPWVGNSVGDTLYETDTGNIILWDGASWRQTTADGIQWSPAAIGHADDINYNGGIRAVDTNHQYYITVQPEVHLDAARVDGAAVPSQPAIGSTVAQWTDRSGNGENYTTALTGFTYGVDSGNPHVAHIGNKYLLAATALQTTSEFTQIVVISNDTSDTRVKNTSLFKQNLAAGYPEWNSDGGGNTTTFPGDPLTGLLAGDNIHNKLSQTQGYCGTLYTNIGAGTSEYYDTETNAQRTKLVGNLRARLGGDTTPICMISQRSATTHAVWHNGNHLLAAKAAPATYLLYYQSLGAGGYGGGQQFMHEAMHFNSALGTTDLNRVVNYLTAKWASLGVITGIKPF